LMRHGADVQARNRDKLTPLDCARRDLAAKMVEVLTGQSPGVSSQLH